MMPPPDRGCQEEARGDAECAGQSAARNRFAGQGVGHHPRHRRNPPVRTPWNDHGEKVEERDAAAEGTGGSARGSAETGSASRERDADQESGMRLEGFEPPTNGLEGRRSSPELQAPTYRVALDSGQYSSDCGRSSVISNQGALEPANMCSVGRT